MLDRTATCFLPTGARDGLGSLAGQLFNILFYLHSSARGPMSRVLHSIQAVLWIHNY